MKATRILGTLTIFIASANAQAMSFGHEVRLTFSANVKADYYGERTDISRLIVMGAYATHVWTQGQQVNGSHQTDLRFQTDLHDRDGKEITSVGDGSKWDVSYDYVLPKIVSSQLILNKQDYLMYSIGILAELDLIQSIEIDINDPGAPRIHKVYCSKVNPVAKQSSYVALDQDQLTELFHSSYGIQVSLVKQLIGDENYQSHLQNIRKNYPTEIKELIYISIEDFQKILKNEREKVASARMSNERYYMIPGTAADGYAIFIDTTIK